MATDIPFVTDDAVRARYAELGQIFEMLRAELQDTLPDIEIEIDPNKLILVVQSYFIDIARYKWWHYEHEPEKARVDGTKKAAFTLYWLNKMSPVYTRRKPGAPTVDINRGGIPSDASLVVGLFYSVAVAFTFLEFVLSDELLDRLLYHMLWREESPKQYMLLFEMLDAAARGNSLFIKTPE